MVSHNAAAVAGGDKFSSEPMGDLSGLSVGSEFRLYTCYFVVPKKGGGLREDYKPKNIEHIFKNVHCNC